MTCNHGASHTTKTLNVLHSVHDDLAIITKLVLSDQIPSNKIIKKAGARIKKSLSRINKNESEAKQVLRVQLHGLAARAVLDGEMGRARSYCVDAFDLQRLGDNGQMASLCTPTQFFDTILTDQGVVLYLAKQIPCNCLDQKKKEMKKMGKVGICLVCDTIKPVVELFQCSKCRTTYCSKDCQLRDWKGEHKQNCKEISEVNEAYKKTLD